VLSARAPADADGIVTAHSARSAVIGTIFVTRRAGMKHASAAIAPRKILA
jgi:hypothetical protein